MNPKLLATMVVASVGCPDTRQDREILDKMHVKPAGAWRPDRRR
jgi:hypothetical protein